MTSASTIVENMSKSSIYIYIYIYSPSELTFWTTLAYLQMEVVSVAEV
jgi:hypothetical protein